MKSFKNCYTKLVRRFFKVKNINLIMYCSHKFLLLFILLFTSFSDAEELSDVLRDAYNYFPDIKKSKKDLENAKRDLQISKTDFLPSIEFSSSQGRNISRSFPDTSNRGDTTISPTTFDVDLTQPLSYAKMVTLKQSRNNLKISQLKDQSVTQSDRKSVV